MASTCMLSMVKKHESLIAWCSEWVLWKLKANSGKVKELENVITRSIDIHLHHISTINPRHKKDKNRIKFSLCFARMFDFISHFSSPQEHILCVYLFIFQLQQIGSITSSHSLIESDVDSMLISFWQPPWENSSRKNSKLK